MLTARKPELAPVTVRPVRTPRERQAFIGFPYAFYRNCRHWTAPLRRDQAELLDPDRHPFFTHGTIAPFMAVDGSGAVVGRIAAIVNGRHLETHRDGVGFFGFFESIDDEA